MRKYDQIPNTATFLAVLAAVMMLASGPALAQGNVVVLNMKQLLAKSVASQDIQKQLEKAKTGLQKEFNAYENDLRSREQEIIAEKGDLSADEFESRREAFQKELLEKSKLARQKREELEEAYNKAMLRLEDSVRVSVEALARERGFEIVISQQSVVFGDVRLDITDEVLEHLNKNVKTIKLDYSAD